jgi:hypothetical protein
MSVPPFSLVSVINVISFVRTDLLSTFYRRGLEFISLCFSNLCRARTHVTNCSPIHTQESQVPSVLVFPSHDFLTLAFTFVLPVPQTAIRCYAKSTKRGFLVNWDRRSPEVSRSTDWLLPMFRGKLSVPSSRIKQSKMRPKDCLETSVINKRRLCNIAEERWLIYNTTEAWNQAQCCAYFIFKYSLV